MAFNALEKADPQQLSKFILTEHPQTIALILAHLKPAQASQLVNSLPEDLRVDVITRMASLDEISPEVITRISSVIEQRLKSVGGSTHESYGGVRAVAELLNRLDRGRQPARARVDREPVARPGRGHPEPDVHLRRPAAASRTPRCARSSSAPTRRCSPSR